MVGVNPKFQMTDRAEPDLRPGTHRFALSVDHILPVRWRWVAMAALFVPLSFVLVQCGKAPSAGMLAANTQGAGDSFEERFPKPQFKDRFPTASESLTQVQRQV